MVSTSATRRSRIRPYWLLITVAPLIPALLRAFRAYFVSRIEGGKADWGDITFQFTDWLFVGVLTPLIYVLARYYPVQRKRIARSVSAHFLGALSFGLLWASMGVLLGWLLNRFPGKGNLLHDYLTWLVMSLPWSFFLYLLILGCVYAFLYYHEARERESQQARLAAQLAEARLSALRMQLNPHFLFNSLNAITVLVRDQKTDDASQMLELLSDVLRQVLQSKKSHEVTLDEEL